MKKIISLLLSAALLTMTFAGCSSTTEEVESATTEVEVTAEPTEEPEAEVEEEVEEEIEVEVSTEEAVTIRVAGLTGPTSMGMVKLMEDDANGTSSNDYEFTLAGSADEITPSLIQGELDIAAVPANLASILYNNTDGAVELLAINTLGVIYICETGDTVTTIEDLEGKTILATGKGSTPEYALNYLLSESGLDPDSDVTIEWKSEPAEVVAAMATADENTVAMLPQPYVTVAMGSVEGLHIAIDLNEVWDSLDNGSLFLTGVLVVRSEFAEEYPEAISAFLDEYSASTTYVNENISDAALLIEEFGIFTATVAEAALPYCNITFMEGEEMIEAMSGYLQVLFDQDDTSIGGAMPEDDFYYER